MRLWRLCDTKFAATVLDGEGARHAGARWNIKGRRMVYLSEHLSLAALELLANTTLELAPSHIASAVDVPDDLVVYRPKLGELPPDWRAHKVPPATQSFGDEWLSRASEALMCVPSVIIPEESNYLLNPEHPDAHRIKVLSQAPFSFDPRLFKG